MPNIISSTKMKSIDNALSPKLINPSADLGKMKATTAVKNVSKSGGVSNMSGGLQAGLGAAGSILGGLSGGNLTAEQSATREGIRSAISSAGPIGAIIGAASGVVDAVGAATGLNLDNLDSDAAKRAGAGAAAGANNLLNSLPGVSMLVGMFGGKTAKSNKSAEIDELTSAYGQSTGDIDAAQKLSGKRTLFGKGKINSYIKEQNRINSLLTDIGLENKKAKSNTMAETYTSQNLNRYSGATPQLILSKKGIKFPELDEARKLISSWSTKSTKEELQKFQLGGKMNLIPEGALHARKHQLEEIDSSLEGQITKKGIPVVTKSNDGVVQMAEIEKEEWTLRKDFTDQLESLYHLYQKDNSSEAAIKAGKLICYELLKNTDDRSGLIKSVK